MAKAEKEDSRKGIVFYFEWMRLLKRYPADIRLQMRDAIDEYVMEGVTPDFGENIDRQLLFETFKNQIDRDLEKYKDIQEKRSAAGKKSAESKQGQQTSTNETSVNNSQQVLTNRTDVNNKIETEIKTKKENETKTEKEREKENNKALSPFFGEEYCPLDPNKAELIAREYIQFFNQTVEGTMIQPVQEVTHPRIRQAWYNVSKYGVDKMKEMTTKAAKSKFFNLGRFGYGFDWFMKEENLVKVLEGTYDDTANNNQGQGAKGFGMGIQEQRHIRQLRELAGGDEEKFKLFMETARIDT